MSKRISIDPIWKIALGAGLLLVLGRTALRAIPDSLLEAFAYAIRKFEGWFPGSVSQRNNNPGNLKYAGQAGAVAVDDRGFAIFDSYESGWAALKNQIKIAFTGASRVYNPTMTLYEFFQKYSEDNQEPYAESVATDLGVSPTLTLTEILTRWG